VKDCIRAILDVFSFGIIAACLYAARLFQNSFFAGLGLPLILFSLVLCSLLALAWLFWFRKRDARENLQTLRKLLRFNRTNAVILALLILGGAITSLRYSFKFEPVLRGTTVLSTPFYEDHWTGEKRWIPWFHLSESWVRFPQESWKKNKSGIWLPRKAAISVACPLLMPLTRPGSRFKCPDSAALISN
jgi:hypothetical protein